METYRSIVIVPSRTIDKFHEPAAETRAYEERLLCLLLMLRDPELRVVYVTSMPVAEPILDYYLALLGPELATAARERLTMISADDASVRPLSAKLLERPRLLDRIRGAIPDVERCHLVPYVSTELEHAVGDVLGIPVHGADPGLAYLGTKSGSRELFVRAGVQHPLGVERITGRADAVKAIARLRAVKPELEQVVVKLDAGVSGEGNAIVELAGLPAPGSRYEKHRIGLRFDAMQLEAAGVPMAVYLERLSHGGVVEERIGGLELRSPSVQLELSPGAPARIVSTHDQILSGQRYLGCRFPAEPAYARAITESARRVGAALVEAGARGRAGIDFVVARDELGVWQAYAIEVNLRSGGTTHPLAALELLSGGNYDADTGIFTAPCGSPRYYVATDHLESPRLRALGHGGLLRLAALPRLAADGCGVVFHMLSAIDELGRVGLTAIGTTAADAQSRFEQVQALLLDGAGEYAVA
jgi:hypothetical protein